MGILLSSPKKGTAAPNFSAHDCCGQTARWIKMPLGLEVRLGPGHAVRLGPSPTPKRGHRRLQFSAISVVAKRLKMPLGTKVGFGPCHIVLHGDPAPPKGHRPAIFGPCILWPNGRPCQLLPSICRSILYCLIPWHSSRTSVFGRRTSPCYGRPVADG